MPATAAEVSAARCLRVVLVVYGMILAVKGAVHLTTGMLGPAPAAAGFGIAFILFDRRLAFVPFRWGAHSDSAPVCYLAAAIAFLAAMQMAGTADELRLALGDLRAPGHAMLDPDQATAEYRAVAALPGVLGGAMLFACGRPLAAWCDRRNTEANAAV